MTQLNPERVLGLIWLGTEEGGWLQADQGEAEGLRTQQEDLRGTGLETMDNFFKDQE